MEPYERALVWVGVFILLLGIAWWALGGSPGTIMGWLLFLLAGTVTGWLFVEKVKKDSPQHWWEGIESWSTSTTERIADTADEYGLDDNGDPLRLPGMALFVAGGGKGMDIHLKDGGTPLNTGCYVEEPIDCAIEVPGRGVYHPCKPQQVSFDDMNPHFQAVILARGYAPEGRFAPNTKFYHASTMISSLKPPSTKALDEAQWRAHLQQRAADYQRTAHDAVGEVFTLSEAVDALNAPHERRVRIRRKAERTQEQEDQEAQG